MAHDFQGVAAHEAGHAVVIMAVGVPITKFGGMVGKHPNSFLDNPFETFPVEHNPDVFQATLEPRLQYLTVVGGFAGETTHQGYIEPKGALDDLTRPREVALTNAEIQLLTGLAMEVIAENRKLWEQIYDAVLFNISRSQNAMIPGEVFNNQFAEIGKRFTDISKLDNILKFE